jgi:hypothetical protein
MRFVVAVHVTPQPTARAMWLAGVRAMFSTRPWFTGPDPGVICQEHREERIGVAA